MIFQWLIWMPRPCKIGHHFKKSLPLFWIYARGWLKNLLCYCSRKWGIFCSKDHLELSFFKFIDGGMFESSGQIRVTHLGNLVISSVQVSDSGIYICSWTSAGGSASRSSAEARLVVLGEELKWVKCVISFIISCLECYLLFLLLDVWIDFCV